MIKEDPLTVKCLCHVTDATKYLIVLHATKVIKRKEPVGTNGLLLPIVQLFLSILVTYLLDIQASICLDAHDVEGGVASVLLQCKHTKIIFCILHDVMHQLTHDTTLAHTCTTGERDKLSCPDTIGLVVQS